jgi:hypothetical protein
MRETIEIDCLRMRKLKRRLISEGIPARARREGSLREIGPRDLLLETSLSLLDPKTS